MTILARSKQALSSFNLDFGGESLGSVSVNGRSASWTRNGDEFAITPRRPLAKHRRFVVQGSDFVAVPTVPNSDDPTSTGSSSPRTAPPRRPRPISPT